MANAANAANAVIVSCLVLWYFVAVNIRHYGQRLLKRLAPFGALMRCYGQKNRGGNNMKGKILTDSLILFNLYWPGFVERSFFTFMDLFAIIVRPERGLCIT